MYDSFIDKYTRFDVCGMRNVYLPTFIMYVCNYVHLLPTRV